MCGIVGGVAERCVTEILIEGLKRLEYRGYDSAGLALLNNQQILRERRVGKVANLAEAVSEQQLMGISVLHTPVGQHMVNQLKTMHTRIFQVMSLSYITVLLKTTKN
jgi:glucosamine--fructose-6-phosphate aminotransferase (isomerizing)